MNRHVVDVVLLSAPAVFLAALLALRRRLRFAKGDLLISALPVFLLCWLGLPLARRMSLQGSDLAVIGVPLVAVCAIAVYLRRFVRSVSDYMVASRKAGRYLLCTVNAETGASFNPGSFQQIAKVGYSQQAWQSVGALVSLIMFISGFVGYRLRETRVLTIAQFLEVRYSRPFRVFCGIMTFTSALVGLGIMPRMISLFIVYLTGLPPQVTLPLHALGLGAVTVDSFVPVMAFLLGMALFLSLSAGQIGVMVTDCIEGLFSGLLYLVIALVLLFGVFHYSQYADVFGQASDGRSFINPFNIYNHKNFNHWFVLIGIVLSIYYFRGSGFAASAKTAHEARMASVLGWWRAFGVVAMSTLLIVSAFVLLKHPAWQPKAALVEQQVASLASEADQNLARMPIAVRHLLPAGILGGFIAIGFFGTLAAWGSSLHGIGTTFVQDVVLPLRRRPFEPRQHIFWLRVGVFGAMAFVFTFSCLFSPGDYLLLVMPVITSIYAGGAGAAIIGGLYWRKGTTRGAYAGVITGAALAGVNFAIQNFWKTLGPAAIRAVGPDSALGRFFASNTEQFPVNGMILSLVTAVIAIAAYVLVSLITRQPDFDLDRMLHRGKYRVAEDQIPENAQAGRRSLLARLIGIDSNFTRGDRWVAVTIFIWELFWNVLFLSLGIVTLVRWSTGHGFWLLDEKFWCKYFFGRHVVIMLPIGIFTMLWFTVFASRDLARLIRALRGLRPDYGDDGRVPAHAPAEQRPPEKTAAG